MMGVQYAVQAGVVDISRYAPQCIDCFLVDSNVWLWMTYSNAGHGEPNWRSALMDTYVAFVQKAVTVNAGICCCGLSLAELAHTIEKTECEIYNLINGDGVRTKEYRHSLPGQRAQVVSEIQAAWGQVSALAQSLPISIDVPTTTAALNGLQAEQVDGYDLFILESMKANGVIQVITDDGDYATVPGIQVFTANRNVINAARSQGKLLAR